MSFVEVEPPGCICLLILSSSSCLIYAVTVAKMKVNENINNQGRIWRAFRAFPGRPWRRTQDSVGHKTDDKRERKKNEWGKGKNV